MSAEAMVIMLYEYVSFMLLMIIKPGLITYGFRRLNGSLALCRHHEYLFCSVVEAAPSSSTNSSHLHNGKTPSLKLK
jgi:hypothetical protein